LLYKRINMVIDPAQTKIIDSEILKTASESILPKGHKFDPDFIYVLVRGVSAGEYWGPNNNMDFFEEEELKGSYGTFVTDAKVFKNHENKEVEKAIGDVLNSEWTDSMKCVDILMRVDKQLAPEITRGFLKGTITDVSMGCRVDHVVCSYCGVRAKTRKDYCEHLTDPIYRGKTMPNGIQVYEINKKPKFHDISVVTKGADRTAKAYTVLDGEKELQKETLKKVASMNFEERVNGIPLTKKFEPTYKIDPYEDLGFKKIASKQNILKLAEIEKNIKGNIISILNENKMDETLGSTELEDVLDAIRLFHTEYWDDKTIDTLVQKINEIAKAHGEKPARVFAIFLKTAELAGIELTPMEFSKIKAKIDGDDFSEAASEIKTVSENTSAPTAKVIIKRFRDFDNGSSGMMSFNHSPSIERSLFDAVLSPFMNGRSTRPTFFTKRMFDIADGNSCPMNNMEHFMLPSMASLPSSSGKVMIIKMASDYSAYQNDRVSMVMNPEFEKQANVLFPSEIIKEAGIGKFIGRAALTMPVVYGYSAYQKAKMRNGERASTFGRYAAENPGNATVLALLGGTIARKSTARALEHAKNIGQKAKEFSGVAGKRIKDLKKPIDDAISLSKENTILNSASKLSPAELAKKQTVTLDQFDDLSKIGSIFNNDLINKDLLSNGYSATQIDATKLAMINYYLEDEAACDSILKTAKLADDHAIELYLKKVAELITIELEKIAGDATEMAKDVLMDTMFYPKGTGAMPLLPGSMIDGFIFNKLTKSLDKKVKEPQLNQAAQAPIKQGGIQ
jgi:hypothetical protein